MPGTFPEGMRVCVQIRRRCRGMGIYDFSVKRRDGSVFPLSELKGKVVLIVNTATGCGFTPQYEGLEKLYSEYHAKGLEILDFPCNQFGSQAPGTDEEIHDFCSLKYDTHFDQFSKIEVNGEGEEPLYAYLKCVQPSEETKGLKNKAAMKMIAKISKTCKKPGDIKWNFTKFLVNRNGEVVKRFDPTSKPEEFEKEVAALL